MDLSPHPQDIPLGWAQHSLRSRVLLQVSLNVLKPEKPCGEKEASELQGCIPAGRVPSPLSRDVGSAVQRVSSTLALGLAGGGSLGPLLVRLRGPGMGAPWISHRGDLGPHPRVASRNLGSPQAHFIHEFPSSTQETWPHFALTRVSSPLFLLLCQKGSHEQNG